MSVEHSKNKEGKIVPSLTERKLVESDLETSSKLKILDNFITRDLLQSKKSLQRLIEHANTVDSLEAIKAIWIKPELANYIRKSELGEGKDPQSEKTIRNIEKKKRRGITHFNLYEFEFSEFIWELKVEVHNDGFEMMYAVNRKR